MNVVVPAHGEVGDHRLIERTVNYLRDLEAHKAPVIPDEMSAFYTETHAKNLELMHISV
jgi:hypothetical protein